MKKMFKKFFLWLRQSWLQNFFLKIFIKLHNFSYRFINFLVAGKGEHPKHRILQYDKYFLDHIKQDQTILDLGCGSGHLAYKLAIKAKKVVAIDIAEKNIKLARRSFYKPNINYIVGDATSYSFAYSFDAIILSNVLEHIELRIEFLQRLHQLSNTILLRVPLLNRDWLTVYKREQGFEYLLDKTHYIEYSEEVLRRELQEAGWYLHDYVIRFGELWGVVSVE